MVFVKGVGLNFYRQVRHQARRPHVKNQPNTPISFNYASPLKNPIFDFSGTSPGFWLKTNLRRIHPPTHPKPLKTSQISVIGPIRPRQHAKTACLNKTKNSTLKASQLQTHEKGPKLALRKICIFRQNHFFCWTSIKVAHQIDSLVGNKSICAGGSFVAFMWWALWLKNGFLPKIDHIKEKSIFRFFEGREKWFL